MNINTWLAKVSGQDPDALSLNAIATHSGIVQTTLSRRVKAGDLSADLAITIARAYRYDIVKALVELGFITEEEVRHPHVVASIREATDEEIVAEVARRIREGGSDAYDKPIDLSPVPNLPDEDDNLMSEDFAALSPGYDPAREEEPNEP